MVEFRWFLLGLIGVLLVVLFAYLLWKDKRLDAPLLGLLTLSLLFLAVSILQPASIKFNGVELNRIAEQTIAAKQDAEKVTRQTKEAIAMQIWNAGKWDAHFDGQEKAATALLREVYGKNAEQYKLYLQRIGILLTPAEELRKLPVVKVPPVGTENSFFREYFSGTAQPASMLPESSK